MSTVLPLVRLSRSEVRDRVDGRGLRTRATSRNVTNLCGLVRFGCLRSASCLALDLRTDRLEVGFRRNTPTVCLCQIARPLARVVNPYLTGNIVRLPNRSRGNKKASATRFGNEVHLGDLKGRVVWPNLIRFGSKISSPARRIPCPARRCLAAIHSSPDIQPRPLNLAIQPLTDNNPPTVNPRFRHRLNRDMVSRTACQFRSLLFHRRRNQVTLLRRRNRWLMVSRSSPHRIPMRHRRRPCPCRCRFQHRSHMLRRRNR